MRSKLMVAVFAAGIAVFTASVAVFAAGAVSLPAASRQSPGHESAAPPRAEVLVLGVYHMNNPGRDVFSTEADDVFAPQRQAELAELREVLKQFRPTKIAVESTSRNTDQLFDDYLAGNLELTRNETHQIGYRLAAELGHESVYPVDVDGEYPWLRLLDYVKANGRAEEFDALMSADQESADAQAAYMASHTVLEILLRLNADEAVATSMGGDYRRAHFGERYNWAGPDLLAAWFHRNIRIYGNVVGLVESPDERVLVIMGSGHLPWLRHNFAADPDLRLRKLAELVE